MKRQVHFSDQLVLNASLKDSYSDEDLESGSTASWVVEMAAFSI